MAAQQPLSKIALTGFGFALLGTVMAVASGFGHRVGVWHFSTGFAVLKWGAVIALAGLVVSLAGWYFTRVRKTKRGGVLAMSGVVIAIATVTPPLYWMEMAKSVPRIHDITTDIQNPPEFVEILPLRQGAPNSATYGGAEIARLQKQAYPQIKPLEVSAPKPRVFNAALSVAHDLGWVVIADDADQGRIEATDTTFWFGFKDDVVIRITALANDTRVDVRSLSRVGLSDVGTNAKRISTFLNDLKAALE